MLTRYMISVIPKDFKHFGKSFYDPDTASVCLPFMEVNTIYRWEDSPGLEHSCWKCGTKQKDPKARRSCYGTHMEPCIAYHQTLFAVGRSHTCRACISTEAAHHERHVIIARLVHDATSCDDACQESMIRKQKKNRKHESSNGTSIQDEKSVASIPSVDPTPRDEDRDAFSGAEGRFQSPCERRALKRSMKDKKNKEKAFKNQQRFILSVSRAQVDWVAKVIHGAQYEGDRIGGHPQAQENEIDGIFERHDTFNGAIKEHRVWLKNQVRDSRARSGKKGEDARKRQQNEDVQNGLLVEKQNAQELVPSILERLGVSGGKDVLCSMTCAGSATPVRNTKHKATVLVQLQKEIAANIEKSVNESYAREKRMEGYWRYVTGTVSNRLADNAQSVDRVTGARLKGSDGRQKLAKALQTEVDTDPDHDDGPEETKQPRTSEA